MTQKEFCKAITADVNALEKYKDHKVTEGLVEDVVRSYSKVTQETLLKGDKISIAGFGTFEVANRAAREGRNPQTKEVIHIPASKSPKFKAAKAFKDILNA